MIEVTDFKPEHIAMIELHEAAEFLLSNPKAALQLGDSKYSFTLMLEGKPVACAGVVEFWHGRGEAWAVMSKACKPYFFQIHNVVKRFLEVCPMRRIEASVSVEFGAGHRWVKALGFKCEAPVRKAFFQDGSDSALYALVRGV
jgi:hypothetical protein